MRWSRGEALDLLGARSADPRAEGPDIVLLYILKPGIDGFEVLRQLKEAPRLRHLPVVVISSVEHTSEIARCIELGAEDFLPKPAEPAILRARLNAGLSKVRLHRIEQRRLRDSFARFVPEGAIGGRCVRRRPGRNGVGRCRFRSGHSRTRGSSATVDRRSPNLSRHHVS